MLPALASMAVLGLALGLILAVASRKFRVEVDPRVEQVLEALPGINCGACGYAGCESYAEAVVREEERTTLCAPGGREVASKVAGIMGKEDAGEAEPEFAICACQKEGVARSYDYQGPATCLDASAPGLAGGPLACAYGCLGFGDCAAACPFDAIHMGADGLPHVDEKACTGCKRCVAACPRGLMRVDPESRVIFVRCTNRDKGAKANKLCEHACIACRKCEKECPFDAIHVIDNLAVIDYDKCKQCGKCVKVCPKGVIVNLRKERRERKKQREASAAEAQTGEGA